MIRKIENLDDLVLEPLICAVVSCDKWVFSIADKLRFSLTLCVQERSRSSMDTAVLKSEHFEMESALTCLCTTVAFSSCVGDESSNRRIRQSDRE